MGKVSKTTKKFQKKHLKKTVDQRKIEQKYKKKIGADQKKKKNVEKSDEEENHFDGLSIDEFMEKGPEALEKQKKNVENDHKQDLEDLADKDPEFYRYLRENDQGLLDFEESAGDEDSEEEKAQEPAAESSEEEGQIEVTAKLVKSWKSGLEQHSLAAFKTLVQAFNAAVHATTTEENDKYKYAVTNANVFNSLLIVTLTKAPATVKKHLQLKNGIPIETKKLKTLTPLLKYLAECLSILLESSHDKTTALLILKAVDDLLPYFLSYRRLLKKIIDSIVSVWSSALSEDEVRLAAFSILRSAATTYSKSLLELVIKATYGGVVKTSRKTNIHTMPTINLLKNSSASLYGIDPVTGYQQSFQFIRQLAVHLRTSIVSKKADAYKSVYNWQFVHSLDYWSRVICTHCNLGNPSGASSTLRELIHPLVQVTLGTIRLIPSAQYFPLRFYLLRSLLRLSGQTGVYIPLLPILTETLTSKVIKKPGKASTLKQLDFDHNIRATKAYLGTRTYQDEVIEQFIDLTAEFFGLHAKSIAFPELAIPAVVMFKSTMKQSKNAKFNKQLQRLLEKLNENSKFISSKRNNVDFGPNNRTAVSAFLKDHDWVKTPIGAFVTVQRQIHEEKMKLLRESLEEDDVKQQPNDDEDILDDEDDVEDMDEN